jgi:glycosyltransferase involved in cell wall biosynthesis
VIDGVTGLVVPPDAASLGAAMAKVVSNPRTAQSMGDAGFERVRGITWDDAIDTLIEAARR